MNHDLTTLYEQFQELQRHFSQEQEQNRQMRHQLQQAQRRLRAQAYLALSVVIFAILISPANRAAMAQSGTTLQQLANQVELLKRRLNTLETKTQFMTTGQDAFGYPATTFTGCNVYIQSGSGSTSDGTADQYGSPTGTGTLTGLGNLIIGYNGTGHNNPFFGGSFTDVRTGSHNLIVGDQNNYSSFGGIVAGLDNAITGEYAVVSGGDDNLASGVFSSVSGGVRNLASSYYCSVSGGDGNVASFNSSWVSGGLNNTASALCSTVCGGAYNNASGDTSFVSGGYNNTANWVWASVNGGYYNTASGEFSSVSGGNSINEDAYYGWAAGSYHSP